MTCLKSGHTMIITVFSVGFFSLLAQTLLYRDFLTVFDGNELSTGWFFFSWLIWMVLGALLAGLRKISGPAVRKYELLPLLFPLMFLLQKYLLLNARVICSTGEYETLSLTTLLTAVFFFNAPLSLFNGFLFVCGVEWLKEAKVPASAFYIIDAFGSFVGALAVTLLLYWRMAEESVVLPAVAVICGACFLHRRYRSEYVSVIAGIAGVVMLVLLVVGVGTRWQEADAAREWRRVLHEDGCRGVFVTPQGRYIYGNYQGAFVLMSWGGTVESLPGEEEAAATVAANLAECPGAKNILVVGMGLLEECRLLGAEPEVKRVVWLTPDPDYGRSMLEVIPAQYREGMNKVEIAALDVRGYLRRCGSGEFDLVMMESGLPSNLTVNRYYSLDFFQEVRRVLSANGVFSLGFPGGEGYMGKELTAIGASILNTLNAVFPSVVLQPGIQSRFFAGPEKEVTVDPAILAGRLNALNISKKFPSDGVYTLFDRFAVTEQMRRYRDAVAAHEQPLLNRDSSPVLFVYGIFFALKKMGAAISLPVQLPGKMEVMEVLIAILLVVTVIAVLTGKFIRRFRGTDYVTTGELFWYVFISSVVVLGIDLLLMFDFQIDHGAIFLFFGLINACFMLGLVFGATAAARWVDAVGWGNRCFFLLALIMLFFISILQTILMKELPLLYYLPCFLAVGMVGGTWLPVAAHQMKKQRFSDRKAAVWLEAADTAGGASGGLITALLLLPLLGINGALTALALMAGSCVFMSGLGGWHWKTGKFFMWASIPLILLFSSVAHGEEKKGNDPFEFKNYFSETVTMSKIEIKSGKESYIVGKLTLSGGDTVLGYVFSTGKLAPAVEGYGGKLNLMVMVDVSGKLLDFKVRKNRETPSYLAKVMKRKGELLGKNIFTGLTCFNGDAVTGATYTADGLTSALNQAGHKLASLLNPQGADTEISPYQDQTSPPPGGPRDIDAEKYRKLIKEKKLSSQPALYWQPAE